MRRVCWPSWTLLFWVAAWVLCVLVATLAHAGCAKTPAEAAMGDDAPRSAVSGKGFRVKSMRWDPVLRQRWALIASCEHPEWPAMELPTHGEETAAASRAGLRYADALLAVAPVVRAGDAVQLWSRQGYLRIEAAAVAEQSGGLGEHVRVRLMQRKTLGQQLEEEFSGVVRGPHNVEMQQ